MAEHELGKLGKCSSFLQRRLLLTNGLFKSRKWILLLKRNNLAVIEVKTRSSLEFGLPQDCETKKIQLLTKAIDAYVKSKKTLNLTF
jgi:putative endonuclease